MPCSVCIPLGRTPGLAKSIIKYINKMEILPGPFTLARWWFPAKASPQAGSSKAGGRNVGCGLCGFSDKGSISPHNRLHGQGLGWGRRLQIVENRPSNQLGTAQECEGISGKNLSIGDVGICLSGSTSCAVQGAHPREVGKQKDSHGDSDTYKTPFKLTDQGCQTHFTGGHISFAAAFKAPNVILGL